ncbi:MAG: transporter [Deltaproteobacteria bacterium]|nr:transporter [Deltaproteobacteria bacterium]
MTLPVLIAISIMWVPLGLFLIGKGEAKTTGAICGLVGAVVVIGAILQAAVFKDGFTAGLLFVHGLLYLSTSYALVSGIEDLRSVGNVSLVTAVVSAIYMILFFTGGPVLENGEQLVAKSNYFAFACLGYTILTIEVWLFGYGKFSAKALAWSLIVWVPLGLYIPAFWLLTAGTLPF